MRKILLVATCLIIFLSPPAAFAHSGDREGHEHYALPDIPTIPVEIRNDSDVYVVLYLNSLCAPRIALGPGESVVIADCFKQGLRYQGVAIFYTNDVPILERLRIFPSVRPNEPWIFCKLPPGQEVCDKDGKEERK